MAHQKSNSLLENSDDSQLLQDTTTVAIVGGSSSGGATSTWLGSALNIQTLVTAAGCQGTQIEAPSIEVQDQILFIVNNIALLNIEAKAKEFTVILQEQHYPWFAQYIVIKRASNEPNFHDLYIKFLGFVNSKSLYKAILKATYENCKVLLKSELIKSTSQERLLLKNMGSWLGKLTIGRNKVLRASEIDLKPLIIKAYEKGFLTALLPFICKILEACGGTSVYSPPNPWTTGILQLLAEVHSIPGLKLNILFEIELLFRKLGIDTKDITPSDVLKGHKREILENLDFDGNVRDTQPQAARDIRTAAIPPLSQDKTLGDSAGQSNLAEHTGLLSQYVHRVCQSSGALMEIEKRGAFGLPHQFRSLEGFFQAGPSQLNFPVNEISTMMSVVRGHPRINQVVNALGLDSFTHWLIPITLDQAIQEVAPSIYRSSIITSTSTVKELLVKNHFQDLDQTKLYDTAHMMVATLAGNLAYTTSKEKLFFSLTHRLRNLFISLNMRIEFVELAVLYVTSGYLDTVVQRIQDSAVEKAIEEIDKVLSQFLSMRSRVVFRSPHSIAPLEASLARQQTLEMADHVHQHSLVSRQQASHVMNHRLELSSVSQQQTREMETGSRAGSSSTSQPRTYEVDFGCLPQQRQILRDLLGMLSRR